MPMRTPVAIAFLSVAPTVLVATTALAQPSVPVQESLLRAKPAVAVVVAEVQTEVTVRCSPGAESRVTPPPYRETGTGWFVAASGWLITNAHVVSAARQPGKAVLQQQAQEGARQACLPALLGQRGLKPGESPDVEDQLSRQLEVSVAPNAKVRAESSVVVVLPNNRKLRAQIEKYSPPMAGEAMSGRNLALLHVEAADMPSLTLGDPRNAQLGDRVYIIGFPQVVAAHELLGASAKIEASVTSGAISGFKQDVAGQPVIQTDAAAAPGGSGSPALGTDGRVLGVLSFVTSDQGTVVQGFNFIEPATAIREFLKGSPVRLGEPSRFDAAWQEGLRDYFAGRYSSAARHFAEANRVLPDLPDVKRIEADARERMKTQPLLPWRAVGAAMVAIAIVGYGALVARRWHRNRFRIRPSEVARMTETSDPPVILDVRDAATYERSPVRIPKSLHLPLDDLDRQSASVPIDPGRVVVAYCT
jgi:S1-C subfamily serine protease